MPRISIVIDVPDLDQAAHVAAQMRGGRQVTVYDAGLDGRIESVQLPGDLGAVDADVVDAMALTLGTSEDWSSPADFLTDLARLLGHVRPHPGGEEDPVRYAETFTAATGRDVMRYAGYLSNAYHAAVKAAAGDLPRPTDDCGCGHPLVWIGGRWEHDAAPSLWGDDHDPDADDPSVTDPARVHWDEVDGVA